MEEGMWLYGQFSAAKDFFEQINVCNSAINRADVQICATATFGVPFFFRFYSQHILFPEVVLKFLPKLLVLCF